jgi:hypothetical protein
VRNEIPTISVIRLSRGLYRSGIKLTITIVVVRVPILIFDFTPIIVTRIMFVPIYADIIRTSRRVIVPIEGTLGKI